MGMFITEVGKRRFRTIVQDCGTHTRCHGEEDGYSYCYEKMCVYCAANFVGDESVIDDGSALVFAKRHYADARRKESR